MAASDRMVGSVYVYTIGTLDCAAMTKEATFEMFVDTAENVAIRDTWHYPVAFTKGARMSGTFAAEKTEKTAGLLSVGNLVAVVFETGENQANKKLKVSGNFIVTRANFRESREGCDVQVEMESVGEVTVAAT